MDDSEVCKEVKGQINEGNDSDTGLETCKGDDETSAICSQSHKSLLGYVNMPNDKELSMSYKVATKDSSRSNRDRSCDSNVSSVSFDTWAFAISDSRTVEKQPIYQKLRDPCTSVTSNEYRRAEELAKDWLAEKKVVRFNLDKNEVYTQQPASIDDSSVLEPKSDS